MAIEKTSAKYAQLTSSSLNREHRDCVVRAFSLSANIPYDKSHTLCKKHGRRDRHGTTNSTVFKVAEELGMTRIERDDLRAINENFRWPTLQQFLDANPIGTFYVHRRGHAFTIIDGVVHDWDNGTGPRSRIILAYRATNRH